jgi:hypothetical protein
MRPRSKVKAVARKRPADPIFAAIHSHRVAVAALSVATLASDLPCSHPDRGTPKHRALDRAANAASAALDKASYAMLGVVPTTANGLHDLLRYAMAADPDLMPEPAENGKPWQALVFASVLAALTGKAVRA